MSFEDQNNKNQENIGQEIKQEEEKIDCCRQASKTEDQLKYLAAEFENYKKRCEREKSLWINNAHAEILKDILPIVDDLERALDNKEKENTLDEVKSYLQGFEIILKEMKKLLVKYHVTEIDASGEFNPEDQEAVIQVKDSDREPGQIVQVLQKGYKYKNMVIRPAKVSVAA